MVQQRNQSLDALRGFAILAMVLSGSIAYGDILPAWMYHAQVPPPDHKFIPTIAGITWVDLVFPFFLFSMGAAIPLALQKRVKEKQSFVPVLLLALRRFLVLIFFALFTHHFTAWSLAANPAPGTYVLSMSAFVLIFFQLFDYRKEQYKRLFLILKLLAYGVAIALLYLLPFKNAEGFQLTNSDIIIIVLACMALFGTIIWWCTKNNPLARIGLLPFIMAVFLAAQEPVDGWAKTFYNFNQVQGFHFDWFYRFYFLKYLFIVIPGTLAGEWFLMYRDNQFDLESGKDSRGKGWVAALAFCIVISNTVLLFGRHLLLNLAITAVFLLVIHLVLKKIGKENNQLIHHFFSAGAYLLLLGLFFEAYEGGIKKDHSTYSYYFVSSGLAFFTLIGFNEIAHSRVGAIISNFLSNNGRNPMVAYIAGSLLLTPLLHVSGLSVIFNNMNSNAWLGFLKGVLFTGIVSVITLYFTHKKWFWKT